MPAAHVLSHMIAATLYGVAAALYALTEANATIIAAAIITSLGGVMASAIAAWLTRRMDQRVRRVELAVNSPRRISARADEEGGVVVDPPDTSRDK